MYRFVLCLLFVVGFVVETSDAQWVWGYEGPRHSTIGRGDIDVLLELIDQHVMDDAVAFREEIETIWELHQERFKAFQEQHEQTLEAINQMPSGFERYERGREMSRFAEKQTRVDEETLWMIQRALMEDALEVWQAFERHRLWQFVDRLRTGQREARVNLHELVESLELEEHVDEDTRDEIAALLEEYDLVMVHILKRLKEKQRHSSRTQWEYHRDLARTRELAEAQPTIDEGFRIYSQLSRKRHRLWRRMQEPYYTAMRTNWHYRDLIALKLPDHLAAELRDGYSRKAYFEAFRSLPADSWIECVQQLDMVDDDQAERIEAAIARYRQEVRAATEEHIENRRMRFVERYQSHVKTPETNQERGERADQALERREELSGRVIREVHALLTEEQREACPKPE